MRSRKITKRNNRHNANTRSGRKDSQYRSQLNKRKQKQKDGKGMEHGLGTTPSERLLPQWEYAGRGLEYLQVGRYFGIWRKTTKRTGDKTLESVT